MPLASYPAARPVTFTRSASNTHFTGNCRASLPSCGRSYCLMLNTASTIARTSSARGVAALRRLYVPVQRGAQRPQPRTRG